MTCPNCEEEMLCAPMAIGDIAVCPECGEIAAVACLAPLRYRVATKKDCEELHACENGHKILMYSTLLKAQRRGLTIEPGNC